MAKKKAGRKMTGTQAELRVVRLALPPKEHKEFREHAASQETNMALLARKIVMEWIARHRKEGKG